MPDPDRIRRAAAHRRTPLPEGDARSFPSPIAELQRLAVSANSEQARISALRILLERMDKQRERDEARAATEAQHQAGGESDALTDYIRSLDGAALDRELDAMLSAHVERALKDPDADTGFPNIVAAFRRAVERHVATLKDVARIEAEVERRAEEKAHAIVYGSTSFRSVSAPEGELYDDQGHAHDGEPGFTAPRGATTGPPR